jgi:Family of unknown function (DUF6526)
MTPELTYASHRRYHPLFHFFVLPVLAIQPLVCLVMLILRFRQPMMAMMMAWGFVVSLALLALAACVRAYATKLQDRIIRIEETTRLERLLPADLRGRIGELSTGQLIALRFCSDEELPEMTAAVLRGEVGGREEIKRRIKRWRPDLLRV